MQNKSKHKIKKWKIYISRMSFPKKTYTYKNKSVECKRGIKKLNQRNQQIQLWKLDDGSRGDDDRKLRTAKQLKTALVKTISARVCHTRIRIRGKYR